MSGEEEELAYLLKREDIISIIISVLLCFGFPALVTGRVWTRKTFSGKGRSTSMAHSKS
jgi:hypothetical protein